MKLRVNKGLTINVQSRRHSLVPLRELQSLSMKTAKVNTLHRYIEDLYRASFYRKTNVVVPLCPDSAATTKFCSKQFTRASGIRRRTHIVKSSNSTPVNVEALLEKAFDDFVNQVAE